MRDVPLLLPFLLACASTPSAPAPEAARPALLLMISVDTTRADDLSCYAGASASTPALDGLAARGVRFSLALSQAPTTLASHASLFAGRDAHGVGVVRNGAAVDPSLPLLAERFAEAGWDTEAVLGSSVLEAKMGLSRGFRVYDDDVGDTRVRRRYEDSAPGVTRRALEAADGRKEGRPLFLFVHYFDVHMPWDSAPAELQARFAPPGPHPLVPTASTIHQLISLGRRHSLPEDWRAAARGLHLAEVAWVDQAIGDLLGGLEARGMLADSLVVALSDHGESLGEPESNEVLGHGMDVDPANLHVPLLIAGRGALATPEGLVVDRQVRLMDIGATALALAGLPATLGEGEDLRPLLRGERPPAPASFAEASKPSNFERKDTWNNLSFERSVAVDGLFYVHTPWRHDQSSLRREADGWPALEDATAAARLRARLDAWDSTVPPHEDVQVDDGTRDMLRALGYLEGEP